MLRFDFKSCTVTYCCQYKIISRHWLHSGLVSHIQTAMITKGARSEPTSQILPGQILKCDTVHIFTGFFEKSKDIF